MLTRTPDTVQECSTAVNRLFTEIDASLCAGRDRLYRKLERRDLTAASIGSALRPVAEKLLRSGPVSGMGFAGISGAIVDSGFDAVWWVADEARTITRDELRPADYTQFEWLSTPVRTMRSHVSGPYVDTVCAVDYVMTCSAPVVVDGEVVGIVGADVTVEALERDLLADFCRAGATLVNGRGRVVLSADPRVSTGDLMPVEEEAGGRRCGSLPLYVLAGRRSVAQANPLSRR